MNDSKLRNAGFHHNSAYEIEGLPNDDQISNDSGCPDVATDDIIVSEYNNIPLHTFKDHPMQHDSAYNHITIGPVITTDNTYAHIPNTTVTMFDNTYSHLSDQTNRPEQDNAIETDDSTYNHLRETFVRTSESHPNDAGPFRRKPNDALTDDTYAHINANSNQTKNATVSSDYEDTYNHLGDIPTAHQNFQHGQVPNTGITPSGVSDDTNKKQKVVASRYNYAVVNKHTQTAKNTVHVYDAPHDNLVLEPDQGSTGKHKPYNYAFVNKMSLANETSSIREDRPHEYYVLEPTQSKATKPKSYDYAVVNKKSVGPKTSLANKDGPHEFFVLEPSESDATKTKPYDYAVVNKM